MLFPSSTIILALLTLSAQAAHHNLNPNTHRRHPVPAAKEVIGARQQVEERPSSPGVGRSSASNSTNGQKMKKKKKRSTCSASSSSSSSITTSASVSSTSTAATASATAISAVSTSSSSSSSPFYYLGCYLDPSSPRLLADTPAANNASMTVEVCTSLCGAGGYSYAGLEASTQCFCSSSLSTALSTSNASPSGCVYACPGNSKEVCGGWGSMSLYSTTGNSTTTTTDTTSSSSTASMTNVVAAVVTSSSAKASTSSTKATTTTTTTATGTATTTQTYAAATATSYGTSSSSWSKAVDASGPGFFNEWTFWDYTDPTHGTVNYVDWSTAFSTNLTYFTADGNAVMRVDTTENVSSLRNSVRLHSKFVYTGGMVIADVVHMPTGCGTWPAFWSNGPDWPTGGEIDIIEGVNTFDVNQVSAHTASGCSIPTDFGASATLVTGSFTSTDCGATDTDDQGCGEQALSTSNAYGAPFNSAGGGVYAMRWDTTGISVWFFGRDSIPSDITDENPDPTGWGTPMGAFPSTDCDPYTYFYDHFNIFDTTLCGDWAGDVWSSSNSAAGQTESCASSTGYSTCEAFVLASGSSFAEAYWEVKSVKWYQPS